ncbi:Putative amidohydrolase YtcJ-like protein [Cladobotryum mycophilum]|uniref:Amidohydrolase YtcJ-like protein n=1 Tax=Cladobotryum mycophilum TaxID=491253 RepID=A0ABR0S5M5_9HYPO
MASSPILRWGSVVSIAAAVALAVSSQLQSPLTSDSLGDASTYCYKGVRTHDDKIPSARCFSVKDGLISHVWADNEELPSDAIRIGSSDGYAIPGLWDGHGHLSQYAEFIHSVDLFGSQTIEEALGRIKKYVASNPGAGTKDNWVRGGGWDQTLFGRMPTAHDIEQDEDLKGIYLMIDRTDYHCNWVSQAVIDLLPGDIPDIPGGEVIRDPGLGVFCDNSMDWVMEYWPKPGLKETAQAVKKAMAKLNEVGLVGLHDAGATPTEIKLYNEMADSDDWTIRVYGMLTCEERNAFCPDDAIKVHRDDNRLIVRSVKLFADGALGSWGSAMIKPYSDHPWSSGSLLINSSTLTQLTKSWASEGYQVNIHAIGDLANRYVVDAFEAALKEQCPGKDLTECQSTHRFRMEHSQIIHPDDQKRMHVMGLIPSIQPTHATSDMKYAEDRLGPQRTQNEAYRMKSVVDLNPVFGSDCPVEPPDPFQGIYAAVARKSPHTGLGPYPEDPNRGWHLEEALSLDEAIWGFTGGAAHGAFLEDKAGVIKEGSFADWVVLDEPLEDIDIEKLRNIRVRETWVGGRKVYSRDP